MANTEHRGYYKSYEVTIRLNGKRISTVPFHKIDSVIGFIDKIIMSHIIYEDAIRVFVHNDYKVAIVQEEGWYTITVVQVEREFMDICDVIEDAKSK